MPHPSSTRDCTTAKHLISGGRRSFPRWLKETFIRPRVQRTPRWVAVEESDCPGRSPRPTSRSRFRLYLSDRSDLNTRRPYSSCHHLYGCVRNSTHSPRRDRCHRLLEETGLAKVDIPAPKAWSVNNCHPVMTRRVFTFRFRDSRLRLSLHQS